MSKPLRAIPDAREPPSPPRYRLTFFGEIEREHRKKWLVADIAGCGEISVFYGFPGCGKSVLASDLAAHVAAGLPWFGRKVTQGAVLYVAAERAALVKRRFAAWRKRHELDGLPIGVVDGAFDLCSSVEGAEAIIAAGNELGAYAETPIVWVVIDTKARVMGGGDPNSDRDIQMLIANVMRIQEALGQPHVTIIDHVPHGAPERLKGSGALAGAIDGSFLVRSDGRVRSLTIGSKPPNDGPADLNLCFGLESETIGVNEDGEETTAPVVVPVDAPPPRASSGPRQRSLTNPERIALTALGYVMDHHDLEDAPPLPGIRPGQKAARASDVKARAIQSGFSEDGSKPDTIKKRWNRALEALVAQQRIRKEGDLLWPLPAGTGTDRTTP